MTSFEPFPVQNLENELHSRTELASRRGMLNSYIGFLKRFRFVIAIFSVVLLAFCVLKVKHLKLRSDFKELLPDNYQSVQSLNRILDRVGSSTSLVIAIESDDPKASIRFAEDLVLKLKQYPKDQIHRIDYNILKAKEFFEENKYLYLGVDDLKELYNRLKRRIDQEKLKATGLFIDLSTEDEKKAEFDTKDLENKYKNQISQYENYTGGYFVAEEGRLLAVVIRPPGASTGVEFSRKLIASLESTIQELNPASYDPSMKANLSGRIRRVVYEYNTVINDILSTAVLCVALVALAVYLYYRNLRMVLLMAWVVINGVLWTFALTDWHIGYLTTQTAFLGSIIVGNGINHSLILMARYLEERRALKNPFEALKVAIPATLHGTLVSGITTSVGFAALLVTDIKGFAHFGFIGGLGMFLCWVASYLLLPVFLLISESILPLVRTPQNPKPRFSVMSFLTEHLQRFSKELVFTGVIFSLLAIPAIAWFVPQSVEYDFSKLRVNVKEKENSAEYQLNDRIRNIFPSSMSPAVLITNKPEQAKELCNTILKNDQTLPGPQMIESCKTVLSYVPEQQEEKNKILLEMKSLLESSTVNFLNPKQKKDLDDFKARFSSKTIRLEDLPEDVVNNFREKNGELGKVVFVYPSSAKEASLWDSKNLMKLSDLIREVKLSNGEVIYGSGDSVIFADLIRAILKDGVFVTLLSFIGVCTVVWVSFRKGSAFFFIIGTLGLGVLWMGGLIALFEIKINFFNFIAIPTTFGIGVDYGVNLYQRYKLEGKGSMGKVLKTTGGAVVLCSVTTIIGYFTLVIAKHQALVSFGWIGIIGEITCLAAAIIFVPAWVSLKEKQELLKTKV